VKLFAKKPVSILSVISLFFVLSTAHAQQAVTSTKKPATYVIETQVQGSQEQPKVIYITPWQELNSTLSIDDHELTIRLPATSPVNPKVFKDKVNSYYQQQKSATKNSK